MKLVGISLSPYFERAVLTLDVKGALDKVSFRLPPGKFGSAALKAANPSGNIPYLLLEDGTCLPEGQIIAEYFNDIFDGPNLMPQAPLDAARTKLIGRIVDLYIGPYTSPLAKTVTRRTRDEAAIAHALETALPEGLDYLELHLDGDGHAVGHGMSLADLAIIPHMFHLNCLLRSFDIPVLDGRPKLSRWWANLQESDIVARSHLRMQESLNFLLSLPGAPGQEKQP